MENAKYYFKYKDYDLAKAFFEDEDGNTIYCDDLGPYGGKRGEVISFNVEDVELDEDDAEENDYTAEDLDRPVVFDRYVSQLSTNTIEWDSTIGDLWCWKEDLDAFKKDHPEYKTEEDKINEIVKMIRDNHIDPKKIMDKLNDKVEESSKNCDMKLTEAKEILNKNKYKIEKLPGQKWITVIKEIFPNAKFKKVEGGWICNPEKPMPAIKWEESTVGFKYEDDILKVWIPDWEHLEDEDYIGGDWTNLYNPKGIKDYVETVHEEAKEFIKNKLLEYEIR